MQEDINNKTVALSIKATKLTGKALAKAMVAALRQIRKSRDAPKHGKQTVKQLARSGGGLQNIEITDTNIKSFDRIAREYGVDYALKKDATEDPPRWLVFFKAKDADALTAAFTEFSKKTLNRTSEKPSVLESIRNFREQIKNAVLEKPPKIRERGGPEL